MRVFWSSFPQKPFVYISFNLKGVEDKRKEIRERKGTNKKKKEERETNKKKRKKGKKCLIRETIFVFVYLNQFRLLSALIKMVEKCFPNKKLKGEVK